MPILLKNNHAGQTPGTTVTEANSANSGDPFSHVLPTTGGTTTYVLLSDGRIAVRMTPTGSATPSTRHTISESQGRVMVTRRGFYYDGTPKSTARPLQTHHSSPFGSPAAGIAFTELRPSVPQIEACLGSGAPITASRVHLPAAGWYEVELISISSSASGANDGVIAMYVYASDGVTLINKQADGTTVVPNVFTNQAITHLHPGSVRWGLAPAASVPTHDDLVDEQALWTSDTAARLPRFESNTQLPAVDDVTITQTIAPTTTGGTNGQIVVTWDAVTDPDIDHLEIGVAPGHNVTTGFTVVGNASRNATSYTITGRSPGPYTVAVRAVPA